MVGQITKTYILAFLVPLTEAEALEVGIKSGFKRNFLYPRVLDLPEKKALRGDALLK